MPRLQNRMCCWRCGVRGRETLSSSRSDSTSSAPSSPSSTHITSRYSETRSGRGRAQMVGLGSVAMAHRPPRHSTQFQFQCTLDRPCIIATIYVSTYASASHISKKTVAGKRKTPGINIGDRSTQEDAPECREADHEDNTSPQSKKTEEAPRGKQVAENEMDQCRCLIVKEPPNSKDT